MVFTRRTTGRITRAAVQLRSNPAPVRPKPKTQPNILKKSKKAYRVFIIVGKYNHFQKVHSQYTQFLKNVRAKVDMQDEAETWFEGLFDRQTTQQLCYETAGIMNSCSDLFDP